MGKMLMAFVAIMIFHGSTQASDIITKGYDAQKLKMAYSASIFLYINPSSTDQKINDQCDVVKKLADSVWYGLKNDGSNAEELVANLEKGKMKPLTKMYLETLIMIASDVKKNSHTTREQFIDAVGKSVRVAMEMSKGNTMLSKNNPYWKEEVFPIMNEVKVVLDSELVMSDYFLNRKG